MKGRRKTEERKRKRKRDKVKGGNQKGKGRKKEKGRQCMVLLYWTTSWKVRLEPVSQIATSRTQAPACVSVLHQAPTLSSLWQLPQSPHPIHCWDMFFLYSAYNFYDLTLKQKIRKKKNLICVIQNFETFFDQILTKITIQRALLISCDVFP